MPESKKQKLTLSVNKAVVEKAHRIGLNLSEITENALRALTDVPKESDLAAVSARYREVFSTMLPLLAKYGLSIQIGSVEWKDNGGQPMGIGETYILEPSGK